MVGKTNLLRSANVIFRHYHDMYQMKYKIKKKIENQQFFGLHSENNICKLLK